MEYESIVKQLGVRPGDRVWLSSELIRLVLQFKRAGAVFDASELIDAFQNALGKEGTLILPTFSFEFSNKGRYDYLNTKGTTGVLGNVALERPDFLRTTHPMHSFAVWGKDQEELVGMTNKNSFGMDSPFGYCVGKHVRQIILGTDYVHAMTFIHYAEVVCNVPYRFAKSFTGIYVTANGIEEKRTYDYAARKLEISPEEQFNKIGLILEKEGVSRRLDISGLECYDIDLASSFPIICEDIVGNMCRNIYDFNIDRRLVFQEVI